MKKFVDVVHPDLRSALSALPASISTAETIANDRAQIEQMAVQMVNAAAVNNPSIDSVQKKIPGINNAPDIIIEVHHAQRLMQAGVSTELHVLPGVFHGVEGFAPTAGIVQRMDGIRNVAMKTVVSNGHF